MRPRASAVPLAVLLAAIVGIGACSGSDGSTGRGATSTSRTRRTTTTTSIPPSSSTTTAGSTSTTVPETTTTTAAPGTCGGQEAIITQAIAASDELAARAGTYTVRSCRIAPSSPIWAAADVVPNPGSSAPGGVVVLERIGAIWSVIALGTSGVGCQVPAAQRAELGVSC
jgi:hypothetical protein